MESAKIFGSEVECHSCESGWTMYLVSSSQDRDEECCYDHHDDDEDSDDDSMASDASSGPMEDTSHLKLHQEAEDVDYGRYLTRQTKTSVMEKKNKKKKKQKKQQEGKEEIMLIETRVKDIIHNDDDADDDADDGTGSTTADYSYVGYVKPMKSNRTK